MYKNLFKRYFFLFVVIFTVTICSGKENICSLFDKHKIFLLDSSINDYKEIATKLINSELVVFFRSYKHLNDFYEFKLYFPEKNEKYKILIPDSVWDTRNFIWDFELTQDDLLLLEGSSIFIFKKNDSNYEFISKTKLLKNCYYLKKINDEIIAFNSGDRTKKIDSISSSYQIIINHKTLSQKITYYKDPKGLKWIYVQPRKLIDINSNYVAISDANRYFIRIENKKSNKFDTLTRNPIKWIKPQNNVNIKDSSNKNNLQDILDEMSNLSLIQRIHFLNNDSLIVVWTSPPENHDYYYELYFDLWGYDNELKKWDIIHRDLKNCAEKDSLFSISDLMISSFVLSENSILSIHHIPYELSDFIGKNKKVVKNFFDDYYRKNKPRYSIIRRTIK